MGTEIGRRRPLGVTIIAILAGIEGAALLGGGLYGVLYLAPKLSQVSSSLTTELGTAVSGLASTTVIISGSIGIALGIAWFVLTWGLWTAKGWAWIVTVILTIISLILGIISVVTGAVSNIISVIINIVILYYLYRPNVKSYFGRGTKLSM